MKLGPVETQFAETIWQNEPLTTRELVALCQEKFHWKRTTTYTVLKKLCAKGLFAMENSRVSAKISKDAFYAIQSENFVNETFEGSLPAFFAAFTTRKKLTPGELQEIRHMIDTFEEKREK